MARSRPASPVPLPLGIAIVAIGGALGAVARAALLDHWPAAAGSFPWTVFAINVGGTALLATLPAIALVRRVTWLPLFLGTGVLGGFTTMSTAAVGSYDLRHHTALAAAYLVGTLAAALSAVVLIDRFTSPEARSLIEDEEGDE